jgi:hypothetical protein
MIDAAELDSLQYDLRPEAFAFDTMIDNVNILPNSVRQLAMRCDAKYKNEFSNFKSLISPT